jgi:hypothetical protein
MSVAPFIRPIRVQGGTFYTFTSASEDLGFSFNADDKKFRFSNYALLNIPDIRRATAGENFLQFDNVPAAFSIDGSKSLNTYLGESFQNYALNLETTIISSNTYEPDEKRTVSERVFFKWLKELGGIRFREANNNELSNTTFGVHYVEENESPTYNKVVKYIGEIDVINNVKNKENAYTEVYVHIPTSHGAQPSVLFTTINDVNYFPNAEFTNNPVDPLNRPLIFGRKQTDVHPAGLDFEAHFDSEFNQYLAEGPGSPNANFFYSPDNGVSYIQSGNPGFQWWYPTPKADTYFLERTYFTDPRNDYFKIEQLGGSNKSVSFVRSRLDGISLEFNEAAYKDIAANGDINSFGELAESSLSRNFEFNTVLVYYEVYDPNNPQDSVKNLFGVLFLDNVDPTSGGGGQIPRLEKVKPSPLTGANGNAYSFKINLKFDVTAEDAAVETTINDYNTFSLELYIDALNELKESTRIFQENSALLAEVQNDIIELQGLVFDSTTADEINQRITQLETLIQESQEVFANNENILGLIDRNYQEILNIYNSQTSLEIAYNLDVIKQGTGIDIDRTSNQQIKISSKTQGFTLSSNPRVSLTGNFVLSPETYQYTHPLQVYSNWLRITDGSPGVNFNLDRDIVLLINDTTNKWQVGQKMRLSFTHGLNMSNTNGNFNLLIYTDAVDKLNTGFTYSAEIGIVDFTEFTAKNGKPIIEIICIDPNTFDFEIDIF